MSTAKSSSKLPQPTYETLKAELDHLMLELQREDLEVDTALVHYQRGLILIQQLEQYLQATENTIHKLQAKFNSTTQH